MNKKIFIFEDEVHIHRLIKLILTKGGFDTVVFENGQVGYDELLVADRPDLILMDIMMPGMDGLEVLKKIKDNDKLKDIPVVLLTALSQQNIVVQGIKAGAVDYIRKPFHPVEMVDRLKKHIK